MSSSEDAPSPQVRARVETCAAGRVPKLLRDRGSGATAMAPPAFFVTLFAASQAPKRKRGAGARAVEQAGIARQARAAA